MTGDWVTKQKTLPMLFVHQKACFAPCCPLCGSLYKHHHALHHHPSIRSTAAQTSLDAPGAPRPRGTGSPSPALTGAVAKDCQPACVPLPAHSPISVLLAGCHDAFVFAKRILVINYSARVSYTLSPNARTRTATLPLYSVKMPILNGPLSLCLAACHPVDYSVHATERLDITFPTLFPATPTPPPASPSRGRQNSASPSLYQFVRPRRARPLSK